MTETTLRDLIKTWRAISNDAKPSADCDLDMVLMARDGQYAETLAKCADELEAALADHGRPETTPVGTPTYENVWIVTEFEGGGIRGVFVSQPDAESEIAAIRTEHPDLTRSDFVIEVQRVRRSGAQVSVSPPVVAAVPEGPQANDIRAIVSSYGFLLMRLAVAKDAQDTFDVCKREFQEHEPALKRLQDTFIHGRPPVADSVRQELCICAAIQFADGRIVRGHRHDACFRTAEGWTPKPELHGHVQGFVTSHNRFVDRKEGWRLMSMTGGHSAHTGLAFAGQADGELFSEDLYFDSHDHVAWNTPYVEPADSVRAPQATEEPTGWWCACGHPNGINLAVCACCSRAPGGPDNPVQTIYRATPLSDSVRASTDEIAQSWAVLGKSYQDRYGSLPDAIRALGEALKASEAVNWQEHDAMKRQMRKDIERELAASSASAETPADMLNDLAETWEKRALGCHAMHLNPQATLLNQVAGELRAALVRSEPPAQKDQ